MLAFGAEINKMLVRIANWEDPDQTASTSVQNFRTLTGGKN